MGSSRPNQRYARRNMWRRVGIYIILFLAVILIIGSQFDRAALSLAALRDAKLGYVLAAASAIALSYAVAALTYQLLTWPTLRYVPTLMVQTATGLTNRLLPAGLGSMGLYATYIHKRGKSVAASTAMVASNNLFGFAGNALLLTSVLVFHPDYVARIKDAEVPLGVFIGVGAGLAVIVVGAIIYVRLRAGATIRFIKGLLRTFLITLRPSARSAAGLAGNMLNTSLNVLAFSLVVTAVGGNLDWADALMVLSLGAGMGAMVPTPGGIGGVEAGLFAGLLAFGVPPATSLAAVLLQRLLAFWLPIIPGAAIFRIVERRYL